MRVETKPAGQDDARQGSPARQMAPGAPRNGPSEPFRGGALPEAHGLYRVGVAYGRVVHRFRWAILALWVIGLAASVPFAGRVASVLQSGGYSFDGSEAAHANDAMTKALGQSPAQALVVFQSNGTPVGDPTYQQEVADFLARARTFAHVTDVTQGGTGKDGYTTFVVVGFDEDNSHAQQAMPAFRQLLPALGSGPARAYLTGSPETFLEYNHITQQDVESAERVSLPIALVVLLIVFGTLIAGLMPLMLALVAVPVALAVIYAIAVHTWTSVFVLNVATVIGLGISIDYSLFMTRRFREELARGRPVRDAVAWTVATTGEAILFSGLTVMIGFCALFLIGIPFMSSFAIGGAITVGAAVLAALTLLPAVLGILGPRINSLRVPLLGRLTASTANPDREGRRGFWHGWALAVMRRPIIVLLFSAALLVALGWPIFSMSVSSYGASSLPSSAEAQRGIDIVDQQFGTANSNPIYVVVQTQDGSSILTSDNLARLNNLTTWLGDQGHVTGVTGLLQPPETPSHPSPTEPQLVQLYSTGAYASSPGLSQLVFATTSGGLTVVTLATDTKLDSPAGTGLIDMLRAGDNAQAGGLRVQVGGTQALSLDFTRYLYGNFPKAILFILAATYVLLLLMFRSLLLPLKAVLVNVLSLGASYGVLVFVFQWGNFSNVLDFTSSGNLDSTIPILIFCILFGLSMDYEVFLLSRIREEWLRTGNNRQAVALGLEKTGGVITNAALLFVIVTGSFTFTRLLTTKELGLGMMVAVLVDATIIRTLLVPAAMRLLGRWNWWLPGRAVPIERPA
jgi:putative drug exporter of the RND superfamily